MERKNFLDRWGDWTMRTTRTLLRHPTLTVGGATVVLFTVARIPTELFYARFGVRPEDAGLDSVQVLLQGSTLFLVASLVFGLLYGLVTPFLILLPIGIMVSLFKIPLRLVSRKTTRPKQNRPVVNAFRRTGRLAPILVPVMSLISAGALLIVLANDAASDVEAGEQIAWRFVPWKAISVEVMWSSKNRHSKLPGCDSLFYLGEGNGRVVLYDSNRSETYRINSEEVQLDFPAYYCEKPKRADR